MRRPRPSAMSLTLWSECKEARLASRTPRRTGLLEQKILWRSLFDCIRGEVGSRGSAELAVRSNSAKECDGRWSLALSRGFPRSLGCSASRVRADSQGWCHGWRRPWWPSRVELPDILKNFSRAGSQSIPRPSDQRSHPHPYHPHCRGGRGSKPGRVFETSAPGPRSHRGWQADN